LRRSAAAVLAAIAIALALAGPAAARSAAAAPAMPAVALAELPPEAQRTVRSIRDGGPFPYERDGVVFRNFERVLPRRERGYYREYTVVTPGIKHRGARRIVAGSKGELYYSEDHYRTFKRVME
jgi:ribonuclease T1